MPTTVLCTNLECGTQLDCPDEYAGKKARCPECKTVVEVPAPSQEQIHMLGEFRLIKKIGQGGMGVVYEAVQVRLGRPVALKVLSQRFTEDQEYLERFQREAKSAAALSHANITQVHDIGEERGHHFFAMEFVDGKSVNDLLTEQGKLPLSQALHIVEGTAKGLRAAHRESIIHRDIKPDNIMLTRDGEPKLADLGLAKKMDDDSSMTQTGTGVGTPYYMPPEQARNARNVDHRADIYSLGVTLFQLVTGRRPFTGESSYGIILAHAMKPMPSGEEMGTPLPDAVESPIQRMCSKKPEERHQDYDSLLADIGEVKSGKSDVTGVSTSLKPAKKAENKSETSAGFREQETVIALSRRMEKAAGWGPSTTEPKSKTGMLIAAGVAASRPWWASSGPATSRATGTSTIRATVALVSGAPIPVTTRWTSFGRPSKVSRLSPSLITPRTRSWAWTGRSAGIRAMRRPSRYIQCGGTVSARRRKATLGRSWC